MNENEKKDNLSFLGLLGEIKKSFRNIIIWGFVGTTVALIISFIFLTPKYNSTIDLLVNQKNNDSAAQFNVQQADLQSINTYKDVLKKPVILNTVLKEARKKNNYLGSESDLANSISISNEANSKVISVSVSDTNPYRAADLANDIGKTFTKKIKNIMKIDNVAIVTKASVNTNPVSPNKKLNCFLGLVIGLLIGAFFVTLRYLMDKTVKDTEFLTDNLGLINLGQVYHISNEDINLHVVNVVSQSKKEKESKIPSRHRV